MNTNYTFKYGQTNQLIMQLMRSGKRSTITKIVYQTYGKLKKDLKVNPNVIFLKAQSLLEFDIGFFKYYTKKQARLKSRKKARLVPMSIPPIQQKKNALIYLVKFILYQKKYRRIHNYKNLVQINRKRINSISKKKTFEQRFFISLKGQSLEELITNKCTLWATTNFAELLKFRLKYFAKITNRRTYIHFRWKFRKRIKKSLKLKKFNINQ